jgi:hypothetical protein
VKIAPVDISDLAASELEKFANLFRSAPAGQ